MRRVVVEQLDLHKPGSLSAASEQDAHFSSASLQIGRICVLSQQLERASKCEKQREQRSTHPMNSVCRKRDVREVSFGLPVASLISFFPQTHNRDDERDDDRDHGEDDADIDELVLVRVREHLCPFRRDSQLFLALFDRRLLLDEANTADPSLPRVAGRRDLWRLGISGGCFMLGFDNSLWHRVGAEHEDRVERVEGGHTGGEEQRQDDDLA